MAEPLVSDELWNELEPLIPQKKADPRGGAPRKMTRRCLEGIVYVLRTGTQWQKLPVSQLWPSGTTCWRRFTEWSLAGIWPELHQRLLQKLGRLGQINLERAVIDSASVRAKKGAHTPAPAL